MQSEYKESVCFVIAGVVVIDSINFGLFVVKPNYEAINKEIEANKAAKVRGQQTRKSTGVHSYGLQCPHLVETRQCEVPKC